MLEGVSRSGLDVFCVTILAGVLEIRQFADFIVGDKCAARMRIRSFFMLFASENASKRL